ncbi:hypothetical protein [Nannocystis radixulma]|uniref:Lipoprotein n=1 Tax=Nannocystis radixulma TaxID=2995305 RepID=A0ABT5BPA6_9BACT|nr:hypothetical protein [Nannocystis radixulma]MDC0675999.1 hypothetical protein [Nannocystis radixulma]
MHKSLFTICSLFLVFGCDDIEDSADLRAADRLEDEALIDDDEAVRPESGVKDLKAPVTFSESTNPGGCGGPNSCYWAVAGGIQGAGNWLYKASCDSAGFSVVSGACSMGSTSTTVVTRSAPYQNNNSFTQPSNQCFDGVIDPSGWVCEFTNSALTTITAHALCCN